MALLLAQEPVPEPAGQRLPVSLDAIRRALRERPATPLIPLAIEPTFRVSIPEVQRFQDLLDLIEFRSGPMPPGGLYGFEMRQGQGNPWTGQPLVRFNLLPTSNAATRAISKARKASAEEAARREMERALRDFCRTSSCQSPPPPPPDSSRQEF